MGLRVARKVGPKMPLDWTEEQVRDFLDQATGFELDTWQLDKVVDEAIKVRNRQP